jgi:hypothetical protein
VFLQCPSAINQFFFIALLIERLTPNLYGVVAQSHTPFISVVDVYAFAAPLAYQVCVDAGVAFISDKSCHEYFTVKSDAFVVCLWSESQTLF